MNWRRGLELGLGTTPWGWHLPVQLKWALTAASASAVYFELTDEDFNRDDFFATAQFGLTIYGLWTPPVVKAALMSRIGLAVGAFTAPLAPAILGTAAATVTGDLIAHQIDPKEGRKKYRDFITDPTNLTPTALVSSIAKSGKTIYDAQFKNLTSGIIRATTREVERRYEEKKRQVKSGWSWVEDNWRWANPTPLQF